uniref:Polyadenylate-binding protein-interacting protein 1 n=1 Tax=Bubo bubo TaxID=30461 RepID=A0A8C0FBN6_BUBBB
MWATPCKRENVFQSISSLFLWTFGCLSMLHMPGCLQVIWFYFIIYRCRTEYENRDEATKGDETTRKQFHAFVLFLAELYLNLEIKGTKGQVMRAEILQEGLRELLNALFSNPVDSNLICAVKLLKLTGSVLEDAWKEKGKNDMEEMIQRIENVVLDANCSRDVKHMLLKLVELRSSNWGRVHGTSPRTEATPENDPNYFMNEPTFYTSDGVPFTAADPGTWFVITQV